MNFFSINNRPETFVTNRWDLPYLVKDLKIRGYRIISVESVTHLKIAVVAKIIQEIK